MPMSERRIPISDDNVLARLEAGETQQALADDLGVSRWAVRNAADRQRALRQRVAEGEAVTRKARKLERRRAKRRGQTPHPSRAPEHGPPASARPTPSTGKRKSGGRILRPILLDENFCAVDARAQGSIGPAWWLDERDAARAAANDPKPQAAQAEIDRQARLAANHGLDPLIPEQAAQIAAIRRARSPQ
jgi:hypothetical protein